MDRPKIVFLDMNTLHSGELDLSVLEEFGELVSYPTTSADEVLERCKGARTIISNKVVLSADVIANCGELKQIISCATGVNQIDLEGAKKHGVVVQNVAGYSTDSVAQHVWAMILTLTTKVNLLGAESANWPDFPMFTTLKYPIFEVKGKTLGVVGLGEIGKQVAAIGRSFGMEVQALSRTGKEVVTDCGVRKLPAGEFYASSDIVSLHCPLTTENAGMISSETLELMKPCSILINTARGPLINEQDLADALGAGVIAAAGLDVLSSEPPERNNPLITYQGENLLITPHTAWSSIEARRVLLSGLAENLESYNAGIPSNLIC
ncbi:MAG: D-2-hydroxyacid dehydrogenase [Akkermansiaceae bacterium]